jgi:hypothetical protein
VDSLAWLFKRFPEIEYCDLKKDVATVKNQVYEHVNYFTPQGRAAAAEQLCGSEIPTGHLNQVR